MSLFEIVLNHVDRTVAGEVFFRCRWCDCQFLFCFAFLSPFFPHYLTNIIILERLRDEKTVPLVVVTVLEHSHIVTIYVLLCVLCLFGCLLIPKMALFF